MIQFRMLLEENKGIVMQPSGWLINSTMICGINQTLISLQFNLKSE